VNQLNGEAALGQPYLTRTLPACKYASSTVEQWSVLIISSRFFQHFAILLHIVLIQLFAARTNKPLLLLLCTLLWNVIAMSQRLFSFTHRTKTLNSVFSSNAAHLCTDFYNSMLFGLVKDHCARKKRQKRRVSDRSKIKKKFPKYV